MTRELIIWVLFAGLVGSSWLMVFSITGDDRHTATGVHPHASTQLKENGTPSYREMAA